MNRYESSTPRAALGLTAVAMAAITMGTLVVLPAKFDSVSAAPSTVAAANTPTNAPIESAISAARTDEPAVVAREERAQADCTDPGTQALRAKRHRSNPRGRRYLPCAIKYSIFGTAGLQPAFS